MKRENRGRKRPPDAELILAQVKREFASKKKELGSVEAAAKELEVSVPSFYNYLNGKTVPDLEVLRKAADRWRIKWKHIDFTEVMRKRRVSTEQQMAFEFLDAVQVNDVEIMQVDRHGSELRMAVKIRFPVKS